MKVGDSITCPHCGKETFLKKESVMNGWTKVGEVLKCAACSAEIAPVEHSESDHKKNTAAAERLRMVLGAEEVKKTEISLSESEKRFCKDCIHLVQHPFVLRCDIDSHPVNSMDDCPKFKSK